MHLIHLIKVASFLVLLSFAFFPQLVFAKKNLVIATGLTKPPYVIQKNDSGFELDLLTNIVERMGMTAKFVYTSFAHSYEMLKVKQVDAVMTTNEKAFTDSSQLSDVYINYQNVAVSLKANNYTIAHIAELEHYALVSFQNAEKLLGQTFASAAANAPLFLTVARQSQQVTLLMKKRVDVAVMDINIFKQLAKENHVNDIDALFTFHPIFPKNDYRMAFKNKKYLTRFNEVLGQYKQTDEYQQLKQKYNISQ